MTTGACARPSEPASEQGWRPTLVLSKVRRHSVACARPPAQARALRRGCVRSICRRTGFIWRQATMRGLFAELAREAIATKEPGARRHGGRL